MKKYISLGIVFFVFLSMFLPSLLSRGMFMDGLLYAAVSKNMAFGHGSFWTPQLSTTILNPFYEHPPLAIGMQSLFFYVFGDQFWIEDIYQLIISILLGVVMIKIWKALNQDAKNNWLPLMLLVSCPVFIWGVTNGMLEITMTLFTTSALYFYLASRNNSGFLFFSGVCILLAFLSKGVFCLYLWGMPFMVWIVKRESGVIKMLFDSFILVVIPCLGMFLLVWFNDAAYDYMSAYINNQVVGSVKNVATVSSRWAILFDFIKDSSIMIGVLLVFAIFQRKHLRSLKVNKHVWVFLLIVGSGVLPIMLSMKQRGFYIISVYPIFALAVGLLLVAIFQTIKKPSFFTYSKKLTSILFIASFLSFIGIAVFYPKREAIRNQDLIRITDVVNKHIPPWGDIGISTKLRRNWSLTSYLARYGGYSLHVNVPNMKYYILEKKKGNLKEGDVILGESKRFYLVQSSQ